jgi:hypothetical protein
MWASLLRKERCFSPDTRTCCLAVHTPQQLAVAFKLIEHITHDLLLVKPIRSYSWLPSCRYTSAR